MEEAVQHGDSEGAAGPGVGHADHQESYSGCPIDVGLQTERGHLAGVMFRVS